MTRFDLTCDLLLISQKVTKQFFSTFKALESKRSSESHLEDPLKVILRVLWKSSWGSSESHLEDPLEAILRIIWKSSWGSSESHFEDPLEVWKSSWGSSWSLKVILRILLKSESRVEDPLKVILRIPWKSSWGSSGSHLGKTMPSFFYCYICWTYMNLSRIYNKQK